MSILRPRRAQYGRALGENAGRSHVRGEKLREPRPVRHRLRHRNLWAHAPTTGLARNHRRPPLRILRLEDREQQSMRWDLPCEMPIHVDGPVSSGLNWILQWSHATREKQLSASWYWIAYSEDYHFENMN